MPALIRLILTRVKKNEQYLIRNAASAKYCPQIASMWKQAVVPRAQIVASRDDDSISKNYF